MTKIRNVRVIKKTKRMMAKRAGPATCGSVAYRATLVLRI